MNKMTFHDGHAIPSFGLGVWQIPNDDTPSVVASALDMGYRLIDAAYIYENEQGVGEGLRQSHVAREDIFLTSKVWNSDQGYDKTRAAIASSLARIGVNYLDLCLIHWPCPVKDKYVETWRAFVDARKDGQVKSIGVSNFNADHLDRIIGETGVAPVLNQIELNPKLQQSEMRAFHAIKGIVTQAWTPLGNGASFSAPQIMGIAKRLGASPAQVILKWHLNMGVSVVARSSNEARLRENLNASELDLTAEDMMSIARLHDGTRCGPDPASFEIE